MLTAVAADMAAYNQWMNQRLYALCAELTDEERKSDRGLFFRSIHGTLNHLLLADRVWLGRFIDQPFQVAGLDQELYADFVELRKAREETDADILDWACSLTNEGLKGVLTYRSLFSPGKRRYEMSVLVAHYFNHQTHHRGQLTTALTQMGKDIGPTDLILLPDILKRNET